MDEKKSYSINFPIGNFKFELVLEKSLEGGLDRPWHYLLNCGTCTTPLCTSHCLGRKKKYLQK